MREDGDHKSYLATTRVRHYYNTSWRTPRRTTVIIVVAHLCGRHRSLCGRQVTLQQPCLIPPAIGYTDTTPDVDSRCLPVSYAVG